jgi:putative N6-adenine-specific DNA methylase
MTELLFASATPGLEAPLASECRALDPNAHAVPGGVELAGPAGLHRVANLRLRTASRVLLRLGTFDARDEQALRIRLRALDLSRFAPAGAGPTIDVGSKGSRLTARVVERVAADVWGSPAGGPTLSVAVEGERVRVSIDTSGELLYRRGYREEVGHAPLRETLAAGVLTLAAYDPLLPLWDPMCGSGTLAIEAAWMALRRAPGLTRAFAFESWPAHDPALWERERTAARGEQRPALPAPIWATDIHGGALGQARRNARRGGVQELLRIERRDATVAGPGPGPAGLVVANLPYGKRVGERADLPTLASNFGAALRASVPGWRFALLLGSAPVADALGLTCTGRFQLDNGGLRVTLVAGVVG